MKALVIGYGSIGKRHADILNEMGLEISVLSKRPIDFDRTFHNIDDALNDKPEYIIIASNTCDHYSHFIKIRESGFKGKVLIEKPVFDKHVEIEQPYFDVGVAYNLRFNPIIQKLKDELNGKKTLSVHYYVGQHLASWRKGRNHLENYSAHKSKGGGVLRDLSHEFDVVRWLFGNIDSHHAIGGKYGDVTIDSEDVYAFIFKQEKCPVVSLQMNYLDHVARREIIVNTSDVSYKADLVNKNLWINDEIVSVDSDANLSYQRMHEDMLNNNCENTCSLDEGLEIISFIEEIEN